MSIRQEPESEWQVVSDLAGSAEPMLVESQAHDEEKSTMVNEQDARPQKALHLSYHFEAQDGYAASESSATHLALNILGHEDDTQVDDDGNFKAGLGLDLTIALDLSGSMGGQKLDMCKLTIICLMQYLSRRDRVSLVTFASQVSVHEFIPMDDIGKARLKKIVEGLRDLDSTNLSGGLFAGIGQMQKANKDAGSTCARRLQALFLLTDGHANVGLTSWSLIKETLVPLLATLPSLKISTFGYGEDHDATLLRSISEHGRGMYYFVSSVDTVASCFADCLGGVKSTVAQNVKVTLQYQNGYQVLDLLSSQYQVSERDSSLLSANIGDVSAGDEKTLMLRVQLPASTSSTFGNVQLEYVDVLNSKITTETYPLVLQRPESVPTKKKNELVVKHLCRIKAAHALDDAGQLADVRKLKEAKEKLNEATKQLEALKRELSTPDDVEYVTDLLKDLQLAGEFMSKAHSYGAKEKAYMTSVAQTHQWQRSNFEADDQFKRKAMYRSSAQKKMVTSMQVQQMQHTSAPAGPPTNYAFGLNVPQSVLPPFPPPQQQQQRPSFLRRVFGGPPPNGDPAVQPQQQVPVNMTNIGSFATTIPLPQAANVTFPQSQS